MQSAKLAAALVASAPYAIAIADTGGKITTANKSFYNLFGLEESQVVGNTLADLLPKNQNAKLEDATEQAGSKKNWNQEIRLKRKDGVSLLIDLNIFPLLDEQQEVLALGLVMGNITSEKETEENLSRSVERKLNKRVQELNFINEVGQYIAEEPTIPALFQWIAKRIPAAMQYPNLCVAAVEYQNEFYGNMEAKDLPCQNVAGLRLGAERVGRIYIAYTQEKDFLDEESAMLGSVVQRVESYIERQQTTQQMEQRARREQFIRQISARVRQKTDPETVIRSAVRELGAALERPTFIRLGSAEELSEQLASRDQNK